MFRIFGPVVCQVIATSVLLGARAPTTVASAQQVACDSSLLGHPGGEQPYADRGDRCEGSYKLQVASGLYLQSVFQSFEDFDVAKSNDPLMVEWSPPPGLKTTLRADGLVGGQPYRMDAVAPPDSRAFVCQTAVLQALSSGTQEGLSPADLAVRGSIHLADPGVDMFVPVRIWQHKTTAPCGPVRLALWATARPDHVYVEASKVDLANPVATRPSPRRDLGLHSYPVNEALTFAVTEIKRPGTYAVRVSAELGADRWSEQYLIYVADDVRLSCS